LAVVFDQGASSPLQLKDTIGTHFDIVWVLDRSLPGPEALTRLLKRLGPVVDITDCDVATAVELLAAEAPQGVICFSDQCISITAALARALELPALSEECAHRLVDKFAQRTAFLEAGMDVPRFWRVAADDIEAADAAAAEATFPVVVKPEVGEGSRHTEPAFDIDSMRRMLSEASALGRDTIVEEMIVGDPDLSPEIGDYVSVESVVAAGQITHLMVTGRFPVAPPFRETGFFMPAILTDNLRAAVMAVAGDAIRAVGFTVGSTHTEIKLTSDGPRVIEINGRLGGGMADLLSLVSDVNLFEFVGRVAVGNGVDVSVPVETRAMSYLFYVQAPASAERVSAIDGIDEFSQRDGVVEVRVNRPAGSTVDWRDGNHGNVFSVLGTTPAPADLLELARAIEQKVTISYD
jgi:biotin carboxylase